MIEAYGNMWDMIDDYDGIVITTNGYIKKNGEAVLGRGVAKEAVDRYPWLPKNLGAMLKAHGNKVFQFGLLPDEARGKKYDQYLYTFPVKPQWGPNGEMGWQAKADIEIIKRSCDELIDAIDFYDYMVGYKVIIPRPGCGNGKLQWEDVKPVIEQLLDDRFTVVTFHE